MVTEMLNLMDEDSLACAWGILGLNVPEQKKGSSKLLLRYTLGQIYPEDVDGSDDRECSWYTKLHNLLRLSFFKQKSELSENGLFYSNQFSQNFIGRNQTASSVVLSKH